jgi:hypothetical protein
LCFLGRILFFEWTVVVKWEDVVHVQKSGKGIRIVARHPKEGTFYDFSQLHSPDRVWASLASLHNDAILDTRKSTSFKSSTPRGRSLRRMNSDPLLVASQVFDIFNDDLPSKSAPSIDPSVKSNFVRDHRSHSAPPRKSREEEEETIATPMKLKTQWSQIAEDESSYSNCAVANHELPCDLDTFVSMFINDGAKYSIPAFMKKNGDTEIKCGTWEMSKDNDDGGAAKSRVIEYTHPINAPMAPPTARARKEQIYRKYGDHGLALETKTFVADVPLTDCFYVADRICVEPSEDNKRVVVTMQFDIRFVKTTMFKGIIARTTKGEFIKFMNQLGGFCSTSLGDETAMVVPVIQRKEEPPPPTPPSLASNMTIYLLAVIILLQLWIIIDIRSMKGEMRELQKGNIVTECIANLATPQVLES